jgi:ribosomal protein S12 methylthiotransferase accessory factor
MLEIDLSSGPAAALVRTLAERHGEALARVALLPARLFLIDSPWAPGLVFVGGEADPRRLPTPLALETSFSLAGSGESVEDALTSCIGECAERLSQIERPEDIVRECALPEVRPEAMPAAVDLIERLLQHAPNGAGTQPAWVRGLALSTGDDCLIPADWCLRRPLPGQLAIPGAALSTGCAAGPSFEAAAARALLELVERDAASLWWIGGQRPRPVAADSAAMAEAAQLLARLRHDNKERTSWLLDITTGDLDIPAVAAISVDSAGKRLACGLAARPSAKEAARAAVFEMCQGELALPIVEMKRQQRGDAALNAIDRRHLARAAVDAGTCELLHPLGLPRSDTGESSAQPPLARLQAAFVRGGIEAVLVDLTRPEIGIPAAWALAPELQLMPGELHTKRLERTIAATGGGARFTNGVSLI